MFEMVSPLLLTLFQLNSRAKEFFIRAPLLAMGSISSAAVQTNLSIRGKWIYYLVLGQHIGNNTVQAYFCTVSCLHARVQGLSFNSLIVADKYSRLFSVMLKHFKPTEVSGENEAFSTSFPQGT